MSEFTVLTEFQVKGEEVDKIIESSLVFITGFDEVESASYADKRISIEYYQQLISKRKLAEIIENMGIEIVEDKAKEPAKTKKKNPVARYIDKLASSNEKRFGNQRLDCCDLNKKKY